MKTIIGKTIAIALTLTLSQTADVKADQVDMVIDMSVSQMKRTGDLTGISECLSVSESTFISALKKTMRHCVEKYGFEESNEDALDTCFKTQTISNLSVSDSKYKNCSDKYSDDSSSENEMSEQDYAELSDKEIELLMKQQQADAKETLNALVDMSKGTEDLVTLPIYPTSNIVSHYTNGMTKNDGQKTLPVATFISSDNIKNIIQFYKKSLPDFEIHEESGDIFTIMKDIPDNLFAMSMDLENMPLYSIPHISVYSITLDGQQKTNIAITYKK